MLAEKTGLVTAAETSVRRLKVKRMEKYFFTFPIKLDSEEVVELLGELAVFQGYLQAFADSFHSYTYVIIIINV